VSAESIANSPEEQRMLAVLLSGEVGVRSTEMPSFTSLLLGPLYRGTEVTVK
jgi:hypothetical protein